MFLNEMNVQWMFAEQSRENECSWMIKNVRKITLTTSHIVNKYLNLVILLEFSIIFWVLVRLVSSKTF